MKRVGLPSSRSIANAHIVAKKQATQTSVQTAPEQEDSDEDRRVRRRLTKYEPLVEDAKFEGKPTSEAETAQLVMRAKGMFYRVINRATN